VQVSSRECFQRRSFQPINCVVISIMKCLQTTIRKHSNIAIGHSFTTLSGAYHIPTYQGMQVPTCKRRFAAQETWQARKRARRLSDCTCKIGHKYSQESHHASFKCSLTFNVSMHTRIRYIVLIGHVSYRCPQKLISENTL